ncbi:MAG: polyphenol oxidase family protein [Chloroflexota bacterium]
MIENQKNGVHYFQFGLFREYGRVQHAAFARKGGVSPAPFASLNMSLSVKDDEANVFSNRAKAFGLFGRTNETLVHAHLEQKKHVARVTSAQNGEYIKSDGLITNEAGCGLSMNYGDCAPIYIYDPVNHAIGLGHAGWRGAVLDLPGEMVRAMTREFGSDPETLLAGVGPCIGVAVYEVGEVVITAVNDAFEEPETLLVKPPNGPTPGSDGSRPHFDLAEANRRNLARAGVKQIELSGLCTAERTDLFFSHRAEKGKTGRFGTVLILE